MAMKLSGKSSYKHFASVSFIVSFLLFSDLSFGEDLQALKSDPHRNEAGFFDMHVCNWPDRPQFFMALLSTIRFDEIASVDIFRPDNRPLMKLSMDRFKLVKAKGKPDKKVFITKVPTEQNEKDGWYTARITFKDGRRFEARDYLTIKSLPQADLSTISPANDAENVKLPTELRWEPVPGARFYQVFITDIWNDGQLIFTSDYIKESRLELPKDLIKSGGMYSWRIHSRDLNGDDKLLGDFNSGSLSPEAKFPVE